MCDEHGSYIAELATACCAKPCSKCETCKADKYLKSTQQKQERGKTMCDEYESYAIDTGGRDWVFAHDTNLYQPDLSGKSCCANGCKAGGCESCCCGESEDIESKPDPYAGRKNDDGKLRWDLVPYDILEHAVSVLTHGAKKYDDWNWQNLKDGEDRYFAATMRHLTAHRQCEFDDEESGLPHLAHALASLMFCFWHAERNRV